MKNDFVPKVAKEKFYLIIYVCNQHCLKKLILFDLLESKAIRTIK